MRKKEYEVRGGKERDEEEMKKEQEIIVGEEERARDNNRWRRNEERTIIDRLFWISFLVSIIFLTLYAHRFRNGFHIFSVKKLVRNMATVSRISNIGIKTTKIKKLVSNNQCIITMYASCLRNSTGWLFCFTAYRLLMGHLKPRNSAGEMAGK